MVRTFLSQYHFFHHRAGAVLTEPSLCQAPVTWGYCCLGTAVAPALCSPTWGLPVHCVKIGRENYFQGDRKNSSHTCMNRKWTKDCDVCGCLGDISQKTSEKRVGFQRGSIFIHFSSKKPQKTTKNKTKKPTPHRKYNSGELLPVIQEGDGDFHIVFM